MEPLLSVLFPPRCVGCGGFEVHLCEPAEYSLQISATESCRRCGEPGVHPLVSGRCSACMGREQPYQSARSAFRHEGVARRLVAEFKFGGQAVLGRLMADLARPAFLEYVGVDSDRNDALFVTWVPTHPIGQAGTGLQPSRDPGAPVGFGPGLPAPWRACGENGRAPASEGSREGGQSEQPPRRSSRLTRDAGSFSGSSRGTPGGRPCVPP